jgi:lipopolysaccharide export system protein LptA
MIRGRIRRLGTGVFVLCFLLSGHCLSGLSGAAGAPEKRPAKKTPASPAGNAAEKSPASKPAPKSGPFKSEAPLTIVGDRMEVSQRDRTIVFEGHVTVRQEDLTITGKRMKVIAAPPDKAKPAQKGDAQDQQGDPSMIGRIDRIEMDGGIRIVQREKDATAEKGIYYHGENKIVLLGNPVVSQGADKIQGRQITLFLADGRSVVEGGESSPVQVILHPKKSKEQSP